MAAADLLERLSKVKRTGAGTWLACCPAHEDKSPSLSVRELQDGRVLVHCFAGCGFEQVVGAVGLEAGSLFPEQAQERARPLRRPIPAADVLEAIVAEMGVVSIIAGDMHEGRAVSDEDYKRLWLARERIEEACRVALGFEIRTPAEPKRAKWWR